MKFLSILSRYSADIGDDESIDLPPKMSTSLPPTNVLMREVGMKKIKMVALDLDGTTLNSAHSLTKAVIETLRDISQSGLTVCIATGRSLDSSLLHYINILDLPQDSIPIICYNGSLGCLLQRDKSSGGYLRHSLFNFPVQESSAKKLISFAGELGLLVQYYNGLTGQVLSVPLTDEHRVLSARYAALVGKQQRFIATYDEALAESQSAKLLVLTSDPDDLLIKAAAHFAADEFNIIRGSPDPFFVEFLPFRVSKGSALQAMCDYLHFNVREEVAAFGDGDNDAEMLQLAAVGVAMSNAKPKAKEAADIIIQWTNDEDGVAMQLRKMKDEGAFDF